MIGTDNFAIFRKAILAGIMIGIGVIAKTVVENAYLGAFLFSLGLLSVFELQLNLFTGKVGFKEISWKDKSIIFLGNAIGMAFIIVLYCNTPGFIASIQEAAATKFHKPWYALLAQGIICGMLIHTATRAKANKIITILCIMVFILIGAEHCIADLAYLYLYPSLVAFGKLMLVIIGNIWGARLVQELL